MCPTNCQNGASMHSESTQWFRGTSRGLRICVQYWFGTPYPNFRVDTASSYTWAIRVDMTREHGHPLRLVATGWICVVYVCIGRLGIECKPTLVLDPWRLGKPHDWAVGSLNLKLKLRSSSRPQGRRIIDCICIRSEEVEWVMYNKPEFNRG